MAPYCGYKVPPVTTAKRRITHATVTPCHVYVIFVNRTVNSPSVRLIIHDPLGPLAQVESKKREVEYIGVRKVFGMRNRFKRAEGVECRDVEKSTLKGVRVESG